jgi:dTDP-N-acetylfucosamine:lipid II N-acetylfucosaminyltransferase
MNILHIAPDERFIPFIQNSFGVLSGENRYLIYGVAKDQPKFVTIDKDDGSKYISSWYWFSSEMKIDVEWCDCLIVHFMHAFVARMVIASPSRVKVIWSGWGGDYAKHIVPLVGELVMPQTNSLVEKEIGFGLYIRNFLKKILHATVFGYWERRAIGRVDYFSAPIPDDFYLMKKVLGQRFKAKYTQLNYSNITIMCAGLNSITGRDILIGNSATPTNNHVEAFNQLKHLDLSGRKIIVPLNYGDMRYGNKVEILGRSMFGDAFVPLRDMLPLDEYKQIVARCAVVIMNHRRIQGGGSVVYSVYSGAKVFLNRNNSFLSFFRGYGGSVFEVPENESFGDDLFTPLSETEKDKNRQVLESFWGEEVVKENVLKICQL